MIEVKSITAGYGKEPVLREVSVSIGKGCLTSVIGVNGSGKSTLLKALLSILPLRGGDILVDGASLGAMKRQDIARRIAWLPQGKQLPDMTVEQMVLLGRFPHMGYPRRASQQDRRIAFACMDRLGIAGQARQMLHTLSGGMRQNAYIAMALAQDSDYILLDEPTTYLDIRHQLGLMKTLRQLSEEGKGILAVMHDLPMAFTFSDQIIVMDGGRVLCQGTPEQLCSQGVLPEVFGIDLARDPERQGYAYRLFQP